MAALPHSMTPPSQLSSRGKSRWIGSLRPQWNVRALLRVFLACSQRMDLRIGPLGRRDAGQPPPAPQLQWARVCQLEGPGAAGAKAAAAAGGAAPCVFAAGRAGVRRWLATGRCGGLAVRLPSAGSVPQKPQSAIRKPAHPACPHTPLPARSEEFLPAEAAPAGVHALAVVPSAGSLLCCAADGNVICFDLQSGAKQRVGAAQPERRAWIRPCTSAWVRRAIIAPFKPRTHPGLLCCPQVFSAHIGEVVCATSWVDPRTGAAFVATGGVDFQVG